MPVCHNDCSCKISSSRKRISVFSGDSKVYSISVEAELLKITIEREQLNVWTNDTKLTCYELGTGRQIYQTAHNGEKLSKEDKKKRKQQYFSRLENEKRNQTA